MWKLSIYARSDSTSIRSGGKYTFWELSSIHFYWISCFIRYRGCGCRWWLSLASKKIVNLRVFSDEDDKMNNSLIDTNGDVLVISQFTLHASTKKGNRPSFIRAARPEKAIPLYEKFVEAIRNADITTKTGLFGADMKVKLINDGPVTIVIDSKNRE